MTTNAHIIQQFTKLNTLLRDTAFAISVAAEQDAAYYSSLGQPIPLFDADKNSFVNKSIKEEKIAVNLVAFYALECGIGVLVEQEGNTPLYWLQKITDKNLDTAEVFLFNCFANATWKASQPFRSLNRITGDNFVAAAFLNEAAAKIEYDQVTAAAYKLLPVLKNAGTSAEAQFKMISQLMQDKIFALDMAQYMEAAYYKALHKPVPEFIAPADDTTKAKNVVEEKVATNLAAFYALECGLTYLASEKHELPSAVLQSIIDGTICSADKQLLERFANATWKAGQPFRSLSRITRDNFTPFYFLSKDEIEKDWVQLTTVAIRLLGQLQSAA